LPHYWAHKTQGGSVFRTLALIKRRDDFFLHRVKLFAESFLVQTLKHKHLFWVILNSFVLFFSRNFAGSGFPIFFGYFYLGQPQHYLAVQDFMYGQLQNSVNFTNITVHRGICFITIRILCDSPFKNVARILNKEIKAVDICACR
jgi:hypothetical protein